MWKWATLYVDEKCSGLLGASHESLLLQVTYGGNFYLARMEHEATDLRYEQSHS